MQLYILFEVEGYNKDLLSVGLQMAVLLIFVVFITIVFAFSGAKKLSDPLDNFKEIVSLTTEPYNHSISELNIMNLDQEFYTLFTKFDQLSKKISIDQVRLSKRMQLLQDKNNELMEKNIDLEEIYKNLKLIEKKVKKSKKDYESILENINGMIWVLDGNGKIIYVNHHLEKELSFKSEDLIGKDLSEIIDNHYAHKITLMELISTRDYKKIEMNLLTCESKVIQVEANTSRVMDDDGSIKYIYGICRNISDLKTLHYNYNIKIQEQNLIMDLTETASMNVSMNQVTKAIFDKINSIFGWSVGTIRFLNENNEFELIARTDVGTDYIVSQSLDYENSCLKYVVENNEILYVTDEEALPIKEDIYCQIIEDGYAIIFIPVGNNDIGKGVISLTIDRVSMVEREEMLKSFTNTILIVVERALIYEKLKKDYIRMIKVLAEAGDDKDSSSVGHSNRVSHYAKKIGEALYLDDEEIVNLEICGLLHDIGKIGISDEFLSEEAQKTLAGQERIKEHPSIGRRMLEDIGLSDHILDGIEMHHMNYDLSGYPQNSFIQMLPMFPRIIQVVDEYDNFKIKNPNYSSHDIWEIMNVHTNILYCPQIMKIMKGLIDTDVL